MKIFYAVLISALTGAYVLVLGAEAWTLYVRGVVGCS